MLVQQAIKTNLSSWMDGFVTIDGSVRRNCHQYGQLSEYERDHIVGFREAGLLNKRIDRHLGQSFIAGFLVLSTMDHLRQGQLSQIVRRTQE